MKITLFTDLRYTTRPGATGVDKHIERMACGLSQMPEVDLTLLAASDQENRNPALLDLQIRRFPLSWRASSALWALTSRPLADRWVGDADWVYSPRNDWIPVRKARYAVTIHGAPELDPELPPLPSLKGKLWAARNRIQYRKMCRRADVVLTVSEFMKSRIVSWFGIDPSRVAVVGNGVDPVFFAAGEAQSPGGTRAVASGPESGTRIPDPGLRTPDHGPYVLTVGGLNFLDGGDRVIALGQEIKRNRLEFRIKVAGCQHDPGMAQRAAGTGMIDLLGYVPSDGLAQLMRDAAALYFPTRYETFGMAATEAMAVGTPVVTCRSTAVPEIVGDVGIYIDPDNPTQVVEAIQSVRNNPELRAAIVARGRLRAAAYTWDACVERLVQELERRL